jgi:hypothetical protein
LADSRAPPAASSVEIPSRYAFSAIAAARWSIEEIQAASRARPLRRRADMMARPARVRIRRRKPWVRLRRRLLGWNVRLLTGKLPNLRSGHNSGTVLTRHASQAGRAGGSGRYGSDLLTVRGTAKPVKLMQTRLTQACRARLGGIEGMADASVDNRAPLSGASNAHSWRAAVLHERASGHAFRLRASEERRGVQQTRRTTWRILPTRLQSTSPVASVALRFTDFTQLPQPATFIRQPRCRGTVEGETGCWCICAHSVDICVEVGEVAVPNVPARQGKGTDNSRSLLRVSASRLDARRLPRRLRSHQ